MRVALNLAWDQDWVGGAYYVRNLAKSLARLPSAERPVLILLRDRAQNLSDPTELDGLFDQEMTYTSRWEWGHRRNWKRAFKEIAHLRLPCSFERAALNARAGVVFPLVNLPGTAFRLPWVAWIFDLQHKRAPEFFSSQAIRTRDRMILHAIQYAPRVVVSSATALRDLEEYFPEAVPKADVLSFAVVPDPAWVRQEARAIVERYSLPPKFLLLPNQFWGHKNHGTAFEAIRTCESALPDVCLVCTGRTRGWNNDEYFTSLQQWILDNHLEQRIRILGFIPRADQIQLLRACCAVVQPSRFEGWSTVVEDARVLGKPVILSDLPVHREQNPPGAIYFDPFSANELAARILEQYPRWEPGPQVGQEEAAMTASESRTLAFARAFLQVAIRAIENFPNSTLSRSGFTQRKQFSVLR